MTPQQQATAARLADDSRSDWNAYHHTNWCIEVQAFLRTYAAQPATPQVICRCGNPECQYDVIQQYQNAMPRTGEP